MRVAIAVGLLLSVAGITTASAEDSKPIWSYKAKAEVGDRVQITWVGFAPDGTKLCTREEPLIANDGALATGKLRIWDLETKKEIGVRRVRPSAHYDWWPNCSFTSKTQMLLASRGGISVESLDEEKPSAGANKKDSNRVVVINRRPPLGLWMKQDGKGFFALEVVHRPLEEPGAVLNLVFSAIPDGKRKEPTRLERELRTDDASITRIAVNSQGTLLAVASRNHDTKETSLTLSAIEIGEQLNLKLLTTARPAHLGRITTLLFSPDGKTIASGSDDGMIRLWETGKPPAKHWRSTAAIQAARFTITSLAYRPDGRYLAFGTTEPRGAPNAGLIDISRSRIAHTINAATGVGWLAFSPNGRLLATGSFLGIVELWDANRITNGPEN
jgi:WD40 repeat protein